MYAQYASNNHKLHCFYLGNLKYFTQVFLQ